MAKKTYTIEGRRPKTSANIVSYKYLFFAVMAFIMPFTAIAQSGPITEPSGNPSLFSRTELKRDLFGEEVWDSGIADSIYFDNSDVYILNTGAVGVDGSIPAEIPVDTPINHTCTLQFDKVINAAGEPIPFDPSKLRVVAMLINRNSSYGRVINACQLPVTYASAVGDIEVSDAEVTDVEYFDLAGRRTMAPSNGIFIRVIHKADGTVETAKIAVRRR